MRRTLVAAFVPIVLLVAGCDEGGVLLVENQTDVPFLVRATGSSYTSDTGDVPDQIVVVAPPNSKRVVVQIPFSGGFTTRKLDVLRPDCSVVYSKPFIATDGTYVVIDDDQQVTIRREYPKSGEDAEPTTDCRTMPDS